MTYLKYFIGVLALTTILGCTNFNKLYNNGSIESERFCSGLNYDSTLDLIFIPVEIQGETYRFLFDTGAPNVISKELRNKLAIKGKGNGNVSDSQGNSDKLGVVKLDTIGIGGVNFINTSALVADLDQAVELGCLKIDGIIGANLMKLAYWKIDSKKQILMLSSNLDTLMEDLSNPHVLDFRPKRTFTPMVDLLVNDSLIENFTYDTGSGGYVSLGKNMKLNLENRLAEFSGYGSAGLYGSNLDTLQYGKVKIELDSLSQIGIAEYSNSNKKLLGMEYLGQFIQILDWEKNQIMLFEDELVKQEYNRFPVIPRWVDGALIVGAINTDTIYNRLQLSIGDTINRLGEQSFENVDVSTYCELLIKPDSTKGDILSIELKDGKKHQINRVSINIE